MEVSIYPIYPRDLSKYTLPNLTLNAPIATVGDNVLLCLFFKENEV